MILLPAALFLSAVMAAAWWTQRRLRNAGWVAAFGTYGLGAAAVCLALTGGARGYIVAGLMAAWALRLGGHIVGRSRRGPEDSRYAHFRVEWGAGFERRMFAFLQIQALAALVLLVPVWLAASAPGPLDWVDALGVAVALAAFVSEGVADRQLQAFRNDPRNHGRVCEAGLWSWSRHPNYFFEWLHWCAYPLLALSAGWWAVPALSGMALMYWLLVHVSGIPPLEAQMLRSRGDAYRNYQRRVRAFLPLPKGWTP